MDKVSIIIPTYKRSEFLSRAIESCLNQTYKNIEVIIVDDNEPNSEYAKETKELVSKYKNVVYFKNPKNVGPCESRNNGIKQASGKFVAFLDDDDVFLPTKIEKQIELYKKVNDKKCCMIYCYGNLYQSNGKIKIEKRDCEGNALYEHIMHHIAVTSCWFCPRDILLKTGCFINESGVEEGLKLLLLLDEGYTVYRVPEILIERYEHSVTDSSGVTSFNDKYIKNCEKYADRCIKISKKLYDDKKISYRQYKKACEIKYYWLYNINYVMKNKKGKKEYLRKLLGLKLFDFITFKAIGKYFINN